MKKLGLAGLALIAWLGAPSSANALLGSDVEFYNDTVHHTCYYDNLKLEIECPRSKGCYVSKIFQEGKEVSPFSVYLPKQLVLDRGDDYCQNKLYYNINAR